MNWRVQPKINKKPAVEAGSMGLPASGLVCLHF